MIDSGEIAERQRLERALRESEERFRTLAEFSFDVYWETDAQHRFTRQVFSRHLADAPRAELGKTRWEIPYVEPGEEAWREHRAMLDAHLPFRDFELARPTPNGGKRYVSVSGFPIFDEQGRFTGYRGVGRHITERKLAQVEHDAYVRFLEAMDRINRAMHASDDLERSVGDVLGVVLDVFDADRAWLIDSCDPRAESCRVMERARGPHAVFQVDAELPIDEGMAALFESATSARGPALSLPQGLARRFAIRAQVAITLRPRPGAPWLFALQQCSRDRRWSQDEERLFEAIGLRVADALTSLLIFRDLRESERRLEAAQRLAHVGWWERDFVTSRVALSDESCRIFGVEPVDLPHWHKRWLDLIHPDDRARAAAASEAALRGERRYDIEYRVVRPDGLVRVVHSQGDVTRDESGRPVRQFGVMQDVTELRRAEDALRESEAQLRARQELVDLAQKAARAVAFDWHIGARENENRWSPELEAIYGLEPGSFDRTYPTWKKLIHPDDWPAVKTAIDHANETGDVDAEYRVVHKDGAAHWLRAKGRMFFDGQGRPERMVGFMMDVTDWRHAQERLRASEARFRTFVDHASDAFYLFDDTLAIVDVNRQACENLGRGRDELIGMHPREFDVALDDPSIAQIASRVAAGETITFETRHRRSDGTDFPVEIRTGTFEQGGRRFYLALARDITERKLAEETVRDKDKALEIARAELARVSRLTTLGELTASIAHEVNQPLGAMVTNAAACGRWLTARPPEIAKARQTLESIAADGKRAGQVIGRIRALTKRQEPRKALLDINLKVTEVLALAAHELRGNEVRLETRLASGLPRVAGDRVQLQQVLLNLIVNAIDAMAAVKERHLTIVTRRDEGNGVAVEVGDSGTGLSPEAAERLFEAFYTTKPDGIGIGLSISRSIIESHGGRLWAAPNTPHGAVFRFSLPAADEETA